MEHTMTQEQALARAKDLLPDIADVVTITRCRSIGLSYGHDNEFIIWDHSNGESKMLAHSIHSWEHALAKLAPDEIERTQPRDTSVVEFTLDDQLRASHLWASGARGNVAHCQREEREEG
jgi:hypothetical protein